ncbi:MAG TPA: hypothetical protein VGN12_24950 [Pirellulales bacterium]|jgi:hypothetical protein
MAIPPAGASREPDDMALGFRDRRSVRGDDVFVDIGGLLAADHDKRSKFVQEMPLAPSKSWIDWRL